MKKLIIYFCILFFLLGSVSFSATKSLEQRIAGLSKAEMQSVIEFLADDLLEGRAPGTRGGNLSELYMKTLFKFMDLKPGNNGSYLQPFKLKGFTVRDLHLAVGDTTLDYNEDIVATYTSEEEEFELEADAVFVGFGTKTPLWNWDDFKGVDVSGKILIARVNDPGLYRHDKFEAKTLTYFGRWTYHMEEAARRGAVGILLIHTDRTAGYSWTVVQNSWAGEELYLQSDLSNNNLKFRGWIKEEELRKILAHKGHDLKELYRFSLKKRFKPVNLGFKIKVWGKNSYRELLNHNVVAEIPGKTNKRIVVSAHIDHHGMSDSIKGDDKIFNGAVDNGSAVAAMVMTAKILKEFQDNLYYTVTFLACNAEEAGILGSHYYVRNTDKENIIADINFESTPVWEKGRSIMAVGARFSTLEDMLQLLAEKEGLPYSYFSMSEQGFFYRSDQFPFARNDIPSLWISAGESDESGEEKYKTYWKEKYHTVKDEYDPGWPLEGLRQTIKYAVLLIDHMNTTKEEPKWKRQLTFPLEK